MREHTAAHLVRPSVEHLTHVDVIIFRVQILICPRPLDLLRRRRGRSTGIFRLRRRRCRFRCRRRWRCTMGQNQVILRP